MSEWTKIRVFTSWGGGRIIIMRYTVSYGKLYNFRMITETLSYILAKCGSSTMNGIEIGCQTMDLIYNYFLRCPEIDALRYDCNCFRQPTIVHQKEALKQSSLFIIQKFETSNILSQSIVNLLLALRTFVDTPFSLWLM